MRKVIVIVGQTATGKSALAVKLAKKFNGEIISADSRQVYKGLDIGSAKITTPEMKGVLHHLLDISKPKTKFTVTLFQELANKKIEEIITRGKTPIICGGTGFYIDAVVNGIILPDVDPDLKLRKSLENKTGIELLKILNTLDKARAKDINVNNKLRLIRAIEIATHLGKVPKIKIAKPKYDFIKIGVVLPPLVLQKKIKERAKKMFKAGLLNEIKKLKKSGVSERRLKEFGFEYYKPTLESVTSGTIKYAKRQMTWFKRDKQIKWFSPKEYRHIETYITDFFENESKR